MGLLTTRFGAKELKVQVLFLVNRKNYCYKFTTIVVEKQLLHRYTCAKTTKVKVKLFSNYYFLIWVSVRYIIKYELPSYIN